MNNGKLVTACNAVADGQILSETLTLNVRSWARGEVLKYSKMESWKSGSFRPTVKKNILLRAISNFK